MVLGTGILYFLKNRSTAVESSGDTSNHMPFGPILKIKGTVHTRMHTRVHTNNFYVYKWHQSTDPALTQLYNLICT